MTTRAIAVPAPAAFTAQVAFAVEDRRTHLPHSVAGIDACVADAVSTVGIGGALPQAARDEWTLPGEVEAEHEARSGRAVRVRRSGRAQASIEALGLLQAAVSVDAGTTAVRVGGAGPPEVLGRRGRETDVARDRADIARRTGRKVGLEVIAEPGTNRTSAIVETARQGRWIGTADAWTSGAHEGPAARRAYRRRACPSEIALPGAVPIHVLAGVAEVPAVGVRVALCQADLTEREGRIIGDASTSHTVAPHRAPRHAAVGAGTVASGEDGGASPVPVREASRQAGHAGRHVAGSEALAIVCAWTSHVAGRDGAVVVVQVVADTGQQARLRAAAVSVPTADRTTEAGRQTEARVPEELLEGAEVAVVAVDGTVSVAELETVANTVAANRSTFWCRAAFTVDVTAGAAEVPERVDQVRRKRDRVAVSIEEPTREGDRPARLGRRPPAAEGGAGETVPIAPSEAVG